MTITGKTQARSALVRPEPTNNASVNGTADDDGAFKLVLPLATGPNAIQITATDPAGNAGDGLSAVRRGAGKLAAELTASRYQSSRKKLPDA